MIEKGKIEQLGQLKLGDIAKQTEQYKDLLEQKKFWKQKAEKLEEDEFSEGWINRLDTSIKTPRFDDRGNIKNHIDRGLQKRGLNKVPSWQSFGNEQKEVQKRNI